MIETKKGAIKPSFLGAVERLGFLLITCGNRKSADWIYQNVHQLKLWEGAKLRAVEGEDIPKPQLLTGFFPYSASLSGPAVLDLIEAQNEGVEVDDWKLLRRTVDGHGVKIAVLVDPSSFKTLTEKHYRVAYRFGTVQMRNQGGQEKEVPEVPNSGDIQKVGEVIMEVEDSNIGAPTTSIVVTSASQTESPTLSSLEGEIVPRLHEVITTSTEPGIDGSDEEL